MSLKKMLMILSLCMCVFVMTGCKAESPRIGDKEEEEVIDYSQLSVEEINRMRKEGYKYDFIDFIVIEVKGIDKLGYVESSMIRDFEKSEFESERDYIEIRKVLKGAVLTIDNSTQLSNGDIIELTINTNGKSSNLINLEPYPLKIEGLSKGNSFDINQVKYNTYLLESVEQAEEKYKKNNEYNMDVVSVVSLDSNITLEQAGSIYIQSVFDDSVLEYGSTIIRTSLGIGTSYLVNSGTHIVGMTDKEGLNLCTEKVFNKTMCGFNKEEVVNDKIKIAKKPKFNFVNKSDFETIMLSYINQSFDSIYTQSKDMQKENISFNKFDDVVSVWKYNTDDENSIQKFQYAILVSGIGENGKKAYFLIQCGLLQDGDSIMPFQISGKIDLKKLRDGINEKDIMDNNQNMYTFVTYC